MPIMPPKPACRLPKEPIIFNKAPSCICGPNDDTMIPKGSTKLDYEVELGIVIGSRARYLAKNKAMDAVAGYCLANDVSEREFQIERVRPVVQGQGLRDLRAARAMAGHQGRNRRPAGAQYVAHGQRRNAGSKARPGP